ncbi:hypothetical protein [Escherichia sp. E1130]|uniref:hypothetical protein n=1 Tax=Escherichia sp. E1130 TaxID=2041645 RepID=UPI001F0E6C41|nr:hypothetical protein [Escherichia sp. E1130]
MERLVCGIILIVKVQPRLVKQVKYWQKIIIECILSRLVKKPLSQVEVESKYQIKPGRGCDYVETDVPNEQLEWVPNPRYHTDELTAKGDITLSDNAKITKRK